MNLRNSIFTISTALVCLPAIAQNQIYTNYDKVKLINGTPGLTAPAASHIGRKTINKTPTEQLPQTVRQYTTAPPANPTQLPATRNTYQSQPSPATTLLPPARLSPYVGIPGDSIRSDLHPPSALRNASNPQANSMQSSKQNSVVPGSWIDTYDQPSNNASNSGARHF